MKPRIDRFEEINLNLVNMSVLGIRRMELITNKVKERSGNFSFRALKERGQPVGGVGQPCSGLSVLYLQSFLFLHRPNKV